MPTPQIESLKTFGGRTVIEDRHWEELHGAYECRAVVSHENDEYFAQALRLPALRCSGRTAEEALNNLLVGFKNEVQRCHAIGSPIPLEAIGALRPDSAGRCVLVRFDEDEADLNALRDALTEPGERGRYNDFRRDELGLS